MVFNDVIEKIGMIIDAAGVVVIVTGAAIAFAAGAVRLSRRESAVYPRFRRQLGQAILLGLDCSWPATSSVPSPPRPA